MVRHSALVLLVVFGIALVATRLPKLLSEHLVADPDECVLGLMAKHQLEGVFPEGKRGPPLFFYGQNYGLSIVETTVAAQSFRLFGANAAALKGGMLPLFGLGALCMIFVLRRRCDARAAWLGAGLLLTCPAWLEWALKARGGYVTAFLFTHLALLLLTPRCRGAPRTVAVLAAGACAGVVALSQALWLSILLPFAAHVLWRGNGPAQRRPGALLPFAAALCATAVTLQLLGRVDKPWWSPPLADGLDLGRAIVDLPRRLYVMFGGRFHLQSQVMTEGFTSAAAIAWCAALALGFVLSVVRLARRRGDAPTAAGVVAVVLIVGATPLYSPEVFGYRYLLPLAEAAMLMLLALPTRASAPLALALIGLGLGAVAESWHRSHIGPHGNEGAAENAALRQMIDALQAGGVRHAYVLHTMQHWNLTFESGEGIVARSFFRDDRWPAYAEEVDRALLAGERVAVVGRSFRDLFLAYMDSRGVPRAQLHDAGGRYFWLLDVDEAFVRGMVLVELTR